MTARLGHITDVRPDETLYSALARASHYLGSPRSGLLHEALFGADLPIFDDLPVGLRLVIGSGVFGRADLDHAVREWTLLPYYARYASPERTRLTLETMAGVGRWPHEALASWTPAAEPPQQLRFCVACRQEMLGRYPDLWWRRAHQLPSVLVCPDHGEPLRNTSITRAKRRRSYIPAELDVCTPDAPLTVVGLNPRVRDDLVVLARMSVSLLHQGSDMHLGDHRESYLARLKSLNLLSSTGQPKLSALASALDSLWGDTLELWPLLMRNGRCAQKWLAALFRSDHGSPPLHHLLIAGMLGAQVGA